MKKRWITFDLDGTLMQNPFISWVFPEIDQIVKDGTKFKKGIRDQLVLEHNRLMLEGSVVEAYDWDSIVKKTLLSKGLTANIDVEKLVIKHSTHPKVYLLEEGILDALKQLRENGYFLAAITNGYSVYQLPVLEALQLSPLFDLVITPEKVGYGKPNIKMVEELMSHENRIIAHVGDRIDHDIVFANELDVLSILLYTDMPELLREKDPVKRRESDQCLGYCEQKWRKETNSYNGTFTNQHVPKVVIHSIHELYECLQQNNK